MRTLLALLFAFVLIVTTLEADAIKEENEQRTKGAKRHLLSETALGRKGAAVGTKNLPNKGSTTANANTAGSSNTNQGTANKNDGNNDDDDANDSYGRYGSGSGSSANSHHYFVDVRRPPLNG